MRAVFVNGETLKRLLEKAEPWLEEWINDEGPELSDSELEAKSKLLDGIRNLRTNCVIPENVMVNPGDEHYDVVYEVYQMCKHTFYDELLKEIQDLQKVANSYAVFMNQIRTLETQTM